MTEQSSQQDAAVTPTEDVGHAPPRLPGETHAAYKAFKAYIRMGPERSHERLARQLGHTSRRHVGRWSSAHDWLERLAAYEDALDRARWEEAEAVVRRYRRELAEARGQVATEALEILRTEGIEALRKIVKSSPMDTAKIGALKLIVEMVGYAPPPAEEGDTGGVTADALVETLAALGLSAQTLAAVIREMRAQQEAEDDA